jgi:predicted metal-dependent HD superfamily phosphohydrolase
MGEVDLQNVKAAVRALYQRPVRAYHNWAHIEACLAELEDG